MKISDITFTLFATSEVSQTHRVQWEDAAVNRRYHIWIYSGRLDTTLHSNWIVPHGNARVDTHRALSTYSAKWVSLVKHIVDHVATPEALAQATKDYLTEEAIRIEKAEADRETRRRNALQDLSNAIGVSAASDRDWMIVEALRTIVQFAEREHLEQIHGAFASRGS
jgi:hypothetical protein